MTANEKFLTQRQRYQPVTLPQDFSDAIGDRQASVSLPRDRFWDIQVSKIDSLTRQPLCPGRPASVPLRQHPRTLDAGFAALPQMTGRDFSYAYFVFPLRYRTPDKQCGPGRYRGLTAFASLSMAVSERSQSLPLPQKILFLQERR
ncbi:hypothetical protein [Thiolapillus sp.]|uniref:hypothetical protein n=2 Tax=Thiolapillus sp. TaxID=2017437 RepID=UPI003AF9B549